MRRGDDPWRSLVRVYTEPNGRSTVVIDETVECWIRALQSAPVGSDIEDDIYECAAAVGRLAELGAVVGLVETMHRQRLNLNQELQ